MGRILITGGGGLIGRALAGELAGAGHEVIVLSRRPEKSPRRPAGVRAERWDGRTAQGWGPLADGADAIVNLAGENIGGEGFLPSRWTAERKQAILQSRIDAGTAVVQAVEWATKKPQVVIQASGIGAYGPRGDEIVAEDDEAAQVGDPAADPAPHPHDFLAGVTRHWEASTAAVEALGVRRAIVRSGVVLSDQGGALPRMLLPFRFFAGGWFGSGRQWLSWIHIADEVAGLRFLIESRQASGVFNLTAPQPLTSQAFGRAIGQAMGRPAYLPVPAFALRLALGEVASTVLDGQRALPRRLIELGFRFRYPDAESALRHLLMKEG